MPQEPEGSLITLQDEDGNEREFEHIASLEYEGTDYVALVPAYQEPDEIVGGDGQLVIFRIAADEKTGEDVLETIEDDEEFNTVSQKFADMLEDDYEIEDVDEGEEDEDGDEEDDENS